VDGYKGMLIVISGPSGVGKSTICKSLIEKKLNNVELSVSATTRKQRISEVDGISYYFKSEHEFQEMIYRNEFLEYAKVYDNYYGTPKQHVIDKLVKGINVILEIDTHGAMQVKSNYEKGVFIFIMPPCFNILKTRILKRGTESKGDIKKRLESAFGEIHEIINYDYIVVNDDVDKAVDKIVCILNAESCRTNRYKIDFTEFKEEFYD